ncbi:unnamed protein product [Boreogadus saida]
MELGGVGMELGGVGMELGGAAASMAGGCASEQRRRPEVFPRQQASPRSSRGDKQLAGSTVGEAELPDNCSTYLLYTDGHYAPELELVPGRCTVASQFS